MTPSPADLSYFLEVGSTLNLSRAAERLGVRQPTVTQAIQRIERALGLPVLIRSKKGVVLTRAGRQLLSHSRALLQAWESVRSKALASEREVTGSYVVGCHSSVGIFSLPGFLPNLLRDYPGLEIKLIHDLSRKIVERVVRTEVDVGIVVNPVRHPDLVIRKLCQDAISFWSTPSYLKRYPPRSGSGVLICDPSLNQTQALLRRLKPLDWKFSRVLETPNLELIERLAASGGGVGILPGSVALAAGSRRLNLIPGAPRFPDEICSVYRAENRGVRSIQMIVERISAAFAASRDL